MSSTRLQGKLNEDILSPPPWEHEEVFHSGDAFFDSLAEGIRSAQYSIEWQTYIYEPDEIGRQFHQLLQDAQARGVWVRLLIDGIGSPNWAPREYPARIFHPAPWQLWRIRHHQHPFLFTKFLRAFRKINQRNHRKVCLIDRREAWVGSMNVCNHHSFRHSGSAAWRDTAVRLQGIGVQPLYQAFERTWKKSRSFRTAKRRRVRAPKWMKDLTLPRNADHPWVRLNDTRRARKKNLRDLCERIRCANQRVWITNAYFVPTYSVLRALVHAGLEKKDVRLILPSKSDVRLVRWASQIAYSVLLSAGVQIYEYLPSVLHAKTVLIDDWAMIGSSNLNYRSIIHDLEADVVLLQTHSRQSLEQQFLEDQKNSASITPLVLKKHPWYQKIISWCVWRLRYWI